MYITSVPAKIIEYQISEQPDNEGEECKDNMESGEAACYEEITANIAIPLTYEEAKKDKNWRDAIKKELRANILNREAFGKKLN